MDTKSFYNKSTDDLAKDADPSSADTAVCTSVTECTPPQKMKRRGLLEPEGVWKVFPRQQMAFDFTRTCWQSVAVFAFESEEMGGEGRRKYLVTTYYEFGQQYLTLKKHLRHYYEVIVEGSACHLYFDVEFKLKFNLHVDPISLLKTFIEYVCYQLQNHFGLHCNRSNILDLDSSTEHKFSRHLIVHLPTAVFRDNILAGNFVHYICDLLRGLKHMAETGTPVEQAHVKVFDNPLRNGVSSCPSAERLLSQFVLNERGEKVLICDEGVYTRNRNFRLFLSSKLGKDASLVIAKENEFKSSYGEERKRRQRSKQFNTLMDSFVSNVRYEWCTRLLEFEPPSFKAKGRRRKRESGSTAPSTEEGYSSSPYPLVDQFITSQVTEEGYSSSPYPLVDQFITSQVTRGGVQGSIRRWTYFSQGKLLVYDIKDNRWCENVGRTHKSNNIMIIADLIQGIFYQKCHDPECKRINFRSQECGIPPECNPVRGHMEQKESSSGNYCDSFVPLIGDISPQDLEELQSDSPACLSDEEFLERTAVEMDLVEAGLDRDGADSDGEHDHLFAEDEGVGMEVTGMHAELGFRDLETSDSFFQQVWDEVEGALEAESVPHTITEDEDHGLAGCTVGLMESGQTVLSCGHVTGLEEFDLSTEELESFCEDQGELESGGADNGRKARQDGGTAEARHFTEPIVPIQQPSVDITNYEDIMDLIWGPSND